MLFVSYIILISIINFQIHAQDYIQSTKYIYSDLEKELEIHKNT